MQMLQMLFPGLKEYWNVTLVRMCIIFCTQLEVCQSSYEIDTGHFFSLNVFKNGRYVQNIVEKAANF